MNPRVFLVILAWLLNASLLAQNLSDEELVRAMNDLFRGENCENCEQIDSLYQEALSRPEIIKNDSLFSYVIFSKIATYRQLGKYEESIELFRTDFKKLEDRNIPKRIEPEFAFIVGGAYFFLGKYDSAGSLYLGAAEQYKANNNFRLYSNAMNNLAICFNYSGERLKEIETLQELHSVQEVRNDTVPILSTKINLALTYYDSKLLDKSEELLTTALEMARGIKDSLKISYALTNLANIKADRGLQDSAIHMYKRALKMANGKNKALEVQANNGIATSFIDQENYDSAYVYYKYAYENDMQFVGIYEQVYTAVNYASTLYFLDKNQDLADSIAAAYLPLSREYAMYDMAANSCLVLGKSALRKGNDGAARTYFTRAINYKDSVRYSENDQLIADLEVKYEVEKKQQQVEYLKEQNNLKEQVIQKKNITNTLLVVGSLILLALLVVIIYNQQKLKAANKQLSEQENILQETNEELKILNENRERMIATIAHDLRGPLGGVAGVLGIARDQKDIPSDLKSMLDSSHSASKTTYALLENLLEWAREKQGLSRFKPEVLTLQTMVTEVCDIYSYMAKKKHIALENGVDESIEVYADVYMLATILRNLISNALKFTERGGSIAVHGSYDENNTCITVKDNGVGIPQEKMNELFSQRNSEVSFGTQQELGTGFGLRLCQDLVARHNGRIWAESEVGKGTTFYFELPHKLT